MQSIVVVFIDAVYQIRVFFSQVLYNVEMSLIASPQEVVISERHEVLIQKVTTHSADQGRGSFKLKFDCIFWYHWQV